MRLTLLLVSFLSLTISHAQPGPRGGGPPQLRLSGDMEKLFGANKAFTANVQMNAKLQSGTMSVPAKLSYLEGKTRFEMDMTKAKGAEIPPQAAEQMKQMGMSEMISISRPDKQESYIVYPGLKSYAVMPTPQAPSTSKEADLKKTELGKENLDGHPTTKYKVTIRNEEGQEQEITIWSASDLKDFPIKMEMDNAGIPSTILFQDVKFDKPAETAFNPPAEFQRYTDIQTMMREAMMKRFAPGGALQPPK